MAGKIRSDLGSAQTAVSQFKKSEKKGQHYSLGKSNIAGMKRAAKVSNQLINDLSKLESAVQKQANKFPKLAQIMEERDKQDASDLSQMNWGF